MAIATLPTRETRELVCFTEDPDVKPKNGSKGWIEVSLADIKDGADVIEVRPLNISERTRALDTDGLHLGMLNRVRSGITKVNGVSEKESIKLWIDRCPSDVMFLLGCYIASVTSGDDPQKSQAAFFREDGGAPEGD